MSGREMTTMMPLQVSRVLAGVDLSDPTLAVFERALALSAEHGAELLAVHAVPAREPFSRRARARVALIAQLRRRARARGVPFSVTVQQGDPAQVILLHAASRQVDVIVLGRPSRPTSGAFRTLSVAERVSNAADRPVLVVPRPSLDTAIPENAPRVLVAVDLEDGAHLPLAEGLALAKDRAADVSVLHVVRPLRSERVPRSVYLFDAHEYQRERVEEAWRRLQALVTSAAPGSAVHARVVTGTPGEQIPALADELQADLVVVGVRPRHTLARRLFGGTSTEVIRASRRPVYAVPSRAVRSAPAATERRERRLAA